MKKQNRLFSVIALVLMTVVGAVSVYGATLQVGAGQTYTTIKAAIDAASSGDIINVEAGTYHESQIVVWLNKGFTLQGAGASVTIIDGDNATAVNLGTGVHPGTIYVKNPDTSVKIDGFTFVNPVTTPDEITAIDIAFGSGAPTPPSITISNNHFVGVANNGSNPFDNAVYIYAAPAGVVTHITGNEFDHQWQSIILEQTQGGEIITGNNFHDLFAQVSGGTTYLPQGLHIMSYGGKNVSAPVRINTNTFSSFNGWPILMSAGYAGSGMAKFTDVQIEDNPMTIDGIGIVLRNPATTLSDAALGGVQGATISGNTITSITPGSGTGIWLRGSNNNATIANNKISCANGILNERYTASVDAGISTGINATNNWWGSATGPGAISGVNFDPWYIDEEMHNLSNTVADADDIAVTTTDPPPFVNVAASVTVDIANAIGTGTIVTSAYSADPITTTTFSTALPGKAALKYVDVQVTGLTGGTAVITVDYSDAEVTAKGLNESTLILYVWYGGTWNAPISGSGRDTVNNKIWGTFNVTDLTGAPAAPGGPTGGAPIPTLSEWGVIVMLILIAGFAMMFIRKQRYANVA